MNRFRSAMKAVFIAIIISIIMLSVSSGIVLVAQNQQWISQPVPLTKIWEDRLNGIPVGSSGSLLAIYNPNSSSITFFDTKTMKPLREYPLASLLMENVSRVYDLSRINPEWRGFLVLGGSAAAVVDPLSGSINSRFSLPGARVGLSDNAVYVYRNDAIICLSLPDLEPVTAYEFKADAVSIITNPEGFGIDRWNMLVRFSRTEGLTDPSMPRMASAPAIEFSDILIQSLNRTLMGLQYVITGIGDRRLYIPYRYGSLDYTDIYNSVNVEIGGGWCRMVSSFPKVSALGVSFTSLSPFTISFIANVNDTLLNNSFTVVMDYIFRDDGIFVYANGTDPRNIFGTPTEVNGTITRQFPGSISIAQGFARISLGTVAMYISTTTTFQKLLTMPVVRAGAAGGFDTFSVIYQPYGGLPTIATYSADSFVGTLLGATRVLSEQLLTPSAMVLGSSRTSVAVSLSNPSGTYFMVIDTSKPFHSSIIYSVSASAFELYPSHDGGFYFTAALATGGDVEIGYVFGSSAISKRIIGAATTAQYVTSSLYSLLDRRAFYIASAPQNELVTRVSTYVENISLGTVSIRAPNTSLVLEFDYQGFTRSTSISPNTSISLPQGADIRIIANGKPVFKGVVTKSLDIDLMFLARVEKEEQVLASAPPEIYAPKPAPSIEAPSQRLVIANLSSTYLKKISELAQHVTASDSYIAALESGSAVIMSPNGDEVCKIEIPELDVSRAEFIGRNLLYVEGVMGKHLVDASTCSIVASYPQRSIISTELLTALWSGSTVKVQSVAGETYSQIQLPSNVIAAYPVSRGSIIAVVDNALYAATPLQYVRLTSGNETVISHVITPLGIAASTQDRLYIYTPYTGLVIANISDRVSDIRGFQGFSVDGLVAILRGVDWIWGLRGDGKIVPILPLAGKQLIGVTRYGLSLSQPNSTAVQIFSLSGKIVAHIILPIAPREVYIVGRAIAIASASAYIVPDLGSGRYILTVLYRSPEDGLEARVSLEEIGYERMLKPGESFSVELAFQANITVSAIAPHMNPFKATVAISDANKFPVVPIDMSWKLYNVNISVILGNESKVAPTGSGYIVISGSMRDTINSTNAVTRLRYGNYSISFVSKYYANNSVDIVVDRDMSITINTTKIYTDIAIKVLDEAGRGVQGALVSVEGFGRVSTNANGSAEIRMLPIGAALNISISATGFYPVQKEINVFDNAIYTEYLRRITCNIIINVEDTNGMPAATIVTIYDEAGKEVMTSSIAASSNMTLSFGRYVVRAPNTQDQSIACTSGENLSVKVIVPPPLQPTPQQQQQRPASPLPIPVPVPGGLPTLIMIIAMAAAIGIIVFRVMRRRV
ncbi:MAG: carboxypeptidase-like regulatory domain-containing protein [Sulfolobales archaeon]